jgi:hypothetical protein
VYQPEYGANGRYLLFNPAREDEPLSSLSESFEESLFQGLPEMYFKDDQAQTSTDVWSRFATRVEASRRETGIASEEIPSSRCEGEGCRTRKRIPRDGIG